MEKIEYGYTYHIYNRGINGTDLFLCQSDYQHFLDLYAKHIHPIADTYAWVLLKNHFHILLRIKDKDEMPFLRDLSGCDDSDLSGCDDFDLSGCEAADSVKNKNTPTLTGSNEPCQVAHKKANPSRQFSHFFNGYARYFNIRTDRHGGLFETPFRRIRVNTEKYFRKLVYYIHHNPVKHGFAEHILDWGWSSYLTIISVKPTRMNRETVLGYFDDVGNFKTYHQQEKDLRDIENLLLE